MAFRIDVPQNYAFVNGRVAMRKLMRKVGAEVAGRARALIRQGASKGRLSAAGGPPVSRTGLLASSIKVRPWSDGMGVGIRDTAFYALFLEAGATGGGRNGVKVKVVNPRTGKSRMKTVSKRVLLPHPFLSLAVQQASAAGLGQRVADAVLGDLDFRKVR